MRRMNGTLDRNRFDAVLFDLDGVLTDTAKVHAVCWKKMFDEFLQLRSAQRGEPFVPFDLGEDYRRHVDGKPRYEGVRDFLLARGIELPWGDPAEAPNWETICGLGNRKNELVNDVLDAEGAEVYESSIALVRLMRAEGYRTAVVSSSKNCLAVLRSAGIDGLFEVRVDGEVAAREGLAGKPAPDTFLRAAALLGVKPKRAVVIEDAISGVQAGKDGGFGLVIGVDRHDEAEGLHAGGADLVVSDLGDLFE